MEITMAPAGRTGFALIAVVAVTAAFAVAARAQSTPYHRIEGWPQLPKDFPGSNGGQWGEAIGVGLDPKGDVWVFSRCFAVIPAGAATCNGRELVPPILKFSPSGKLLASWGAGMFIFPHGFYVDRDGNIWATDAQARVGQPGGEFPKGNQVFKFSPEGKVLLTLGKAGFTGNGPDTFDQPTNVAVAANGDIFVTDGHGSNNRVVKFSKDGRFIKTWGKTGSGPGEFDQPHCIAIDSQGRVFVGDRGNSRIQIFDQDGRFIDQWKQFGRPSGIFISKDDTLYVTDSQTNSKTNPNRKRGVFIGSAKDGSVTAFIPDPDLDQQDANRISGASGIAADDSGTVYLADVGPHGFRKYVKR
jgi:sugar lactone lactonase YvrE